MAFKKGESGNNKGRPRGSKNKITDRLRETITGFLAVNFKKIKADFDTLPAKDRAKLYVDLLQYSIPKLQAVNMDLGFDKLNEDELNEIINQLIQHNEQRLQPSKN